MKKLSILALMVPFVFLLASCDAGNNTPDNSEETNQTEHEHSFVLKHDENNHWNECSCGEKKDVLAHDYGELIVDKEATEEATGLGHYICKTCGYQSDTIIKKKDHVHSYTLKHDENSHWNECKCGEKKDIEGHHYDDWLIDTEATLSSEGERHHVCEVCGYTETESYSLYALTLTCDTEIGTVTGSGNYVGNDLVSILAEPKENYIFMGWFKGDELFNKSASFEFNIEESISLTAKFEKDFTKLTYELSSDETYYIVSGIGTYPFTELVIPSEYNNKPVKEIKKDAFRDNGNIVSLRCMEGLEKIDDRAFDSATNLKDIILPESLIFIGFSAFDSCQKIEEIEFKNHLTTIVDYAFFLCRGLKSISIPASVTSIGELAFYDCYNLQTIVVDQNNTVYDSRNNSNALIETETNTLMLGCVNTVIPSGIKHIQDHAFENVQIATINLPDGLEIIGDYAFYSNNVVTTIVMPNTLTTLGEAVFWCCTSLEDVTLSQNLESIPKKAFNTCVSLTSLTIPGSVKSIGMNAFENTAITTLTIPNSVTAIGEEAFVNTPIASIVLSESLEIIDERVFYTCNSLQSIVIPNSVTAIMSYAFGGCRSLKSVTIGSGVTSINKNSFTDCYKIETIIIDPNNPKYDSRDNANAIIETETNTLIRGSNAVNVPSTVTAIGPNAFWYCKPNAIILPEGLLDIQNFGFDSTHNITSLVIPDSVTHIGYAAICFCSDLEYVVIGSGVQQIESTNFWGCSKLDTIYYKDDSDSWNSICEIEKEDLENITIYFYSETEPVGEGNYWHYVENVITIWE